MARKFRLIFMGTSEFALPAFAKLRVAGYNIARVYCQPDKRQGRGLQCLCCPVKEKALTHKIPAEQPRTLKDPKIREKIKKLHPDLIVVAAYGLIIPTAILKIPPLGVVNLHPSLLPQYRGPSPIQAALLAGAQKTGVTLMLVDSKMDHGPIIAQEKVKIKPEDNAFSLRKTLADLGAQMLIKYLPGFLEGKIKPRKQDHEQATFTRLIKKSDGRINWSQSASEIERQIRAYFGWPSSFTFWEDKRLVILEGFVLEHDRYREKNGQVFKIDKELYVQCKEGILRILKLQLEGKNPVSGEEFLRGYPEIIGATLR